MITFTVVLMSFAAVAASGNFNKSMKSNLQVLRASNVSVNYVDLGDGFAKIADENPNRFEPFYYSAYSYILASWQVKEPAKKTEILSEAKKKIDKAFELAPNNDELYVLKAFYYQAMIMLNPQKYGQPYSIKASELLNRAQGINPSNPRAQFLLAQNVFYTPAEYGGGKDNALPLFKKSAALFVTQNTSGYLVPIWGENTNSQMLEKCSK